MDEWREPDWHCPGDDDFTLGIDDSDVEIPSITKTLRFDFTFNETVQVEISEYGHGYEIVCADDIEDALKQFKEFLVTVKKKLHEGKFEVTAEELQDSMNETNKITRHQKKLPCNIFKK